MVRRMMPLRVGNAERVGLAITRDARSALGVTR